MTAHRLVMGSRLVGSNSADSNPFALTIQIWVQLGCNKTFKQFLRAPKPAIGAVGFHTVTSEP